MTSNKTNSLKNFLEQIFNQSLKNFSGNELEKATFLKGVSFVSNYFLENFKEHLLPILVQETRIPLPLPHPRSRIYRSQPAEWCIKETDAEPIINLILKKITANSCVVFDLDGTLFDVSHRTLGIIKMFLEKKDTTILPETILNALQHIQVGHIGYSLSHALENLGLDLSSEPASTLFEELEIFWHRKFFDAQTFIDFDIPVAGAAQFVQKVYNSGIKIVYLTGRYKKIMGDGTLKQLIKHGFPVTNTELITKSNWKDDDLEFKKTSFSQIANNHNVIANFENEYCNLACMAALAPDAIHTILDSQHSGRFTPSLSLPVYRISNFLVSEV